MWLSGMCGMLGRIDKHHAQQDKSEMNKVEWNEIE